MKVKVAQASGCTVWGACRLDAVACSFGRWRVVVVAEHDHTCDGAAA